MCPSVYMDDYRADRRLKFNQAKCRLFEIKEHVQYFIYLFLSAMPYIKVYIFLDVFVGMSVTTVCFV